MPSLVIKSLPEEIHRSLKAAAERHHRSVIQEALVALRLGLAAEPMSPESALASLPKAFKPKSPIQDAELTRMKRLGLK